MAPPHRSSRRTTLLQLAILFLAAFFTFLPSVRHQFIDLDDDLYVTLNPGVLDGLTGRDVRWAFFGVPGNPDHFNTYAGFFIPLTWLSLQMDATIAPPPRELIARRLGPAGDDVVLPAGVYHLDNTVQHALGTALLFLFLLTATGARWPAFVAALLWAVHPLRVESVAWVTERKDTLAALFGFLALYLYVRQHRPSGEEGDGRGAGVRWLSELGVAAAFVASLLAKPTLLMFPVLLLILDWWPLRRWSVRSLPWLILEKVHLFVLAGLAGAVTVFAEHESGALDVLSVPVATRLANVPIAFTQYLWMQVAPVHLSLLYPYNLHPSVAGAAGSLLLLIAITAACVGVRRRWPWLLAGWLWFLMAFVPMIGLLQAGAQAYADRFSLLPSVGLFVMLAWSLPMGRHLQVSLGAVCAAALVLAGLTLNRLSYWQSSVPLMEDALRTDPDDYAMHYNLALALMRAGDDAGAAAHFGRAAQLNPDFPQAALKAAQAEDLFALALVRAGALGQALPHFAAAVHLEPTNTLYQRHLAQARAALPATTVGPASFP